MSIIGDSLTITRKEMMVFMKQPVAGLMRAVIFPITWIVFFAYGFGGTLHSIPIAISNEAGGAYSQQLINNINTGDTFSIHFMPYFQALSEFRSGKVLAVLDIPPGFDSSFMSGNAKAYLVLDNTNPSLYSAIKSGIESSAQKVSSDINVVPNNMPQVNLNEQTYYGRENTYLDFLAPGIVIQTIVFSAMFSGGISLIMDREFGTLKLLMMAPISRASIIMGKIFGGVIQSLISGFMTLIIVMLLGAKVIITPMFFLAVPLIMVLVAFAFIGMVTFIATRFRTLEQFFIVTQTTLLPLWFVSGSIYPIYSMPNWMQAIASVNPLTYAVDGVRTAMIRGGSTANIIPDIIILLAISAVILLIGIRSFKRTIE